MAKEKSKLIDELLKKAKVNPELELEAYIISGGQIIKIHNLRTIQRNGKTWKTKQTRYKSD